MDRRSFIARSQAALLLGASPLLSEIAQAAGTQPQKVLSYAFAVAETGFDPAQVNDIYSRIITAHIFESPLTYDHLARPFKLRPNTAAAMPEVSDDLRTFTFRR